VRSRTKRMRLFALQLGLATTLALASDASGLPQDKPAPGQPGKQANLSKPGLYLNDAKAFRGYTLFSPLNSTKVFLVDMEGKVARTWEGAATPASCAVLLPNGNLLRPCLYDEKPTPFGTGGGAGGRVQEFTWEGKLTWDFQLANDKQLSHHDVRKLPNGNLLMIVGEMKNADEATAAGRKVPGNIRSDCVFEVKPTGQNTGEIVWQWHLWDHLVQDHDQTNSNFGDVAAHAELVDVNGGPGAGGMGGKAGPGKGALDWTHVNSVDYNADLDQILLSTPNFSEVWIIDHTTTTAEAATHAGGKSGKGGDLLYRWGNPRSYRAGTADDQQLFGQHNAHWIPKGLPGEGHILVFNNGTNRPGGNYSAVEEVVTPVDAKGQYAREAGKAYGPEKPLWSYSAPNKPDFFSNYISGAQRQPNGNTLICSGADGIFFEVTAAKEIVWKYVNPVRKKAEAKSGAKAAPGGAPTPGAVFRAYRYAPDYPGLAGRDLKATLTVEELLPKEPQKGGFPVIKPSNASQVQELQSIKKDVRRIVNWPDGKQLALVYWEAPVEVVKGDTLETVQVLLDGKRVIHFAVTKDLETIAFCENAFTVEMMNFRTRFAVKLEAEVHQPGMQFSPDGTLLAAGGYGTAAKLWDVATGRLVKSCDTGPVKGGLMVVFSTDGKSLAVGNRNAETVVFEIPSGKRLYALSKQVSQELKFSPDGKTLAVAYVDGSVGLWNAADGKLLHMAKPQADELYTLDWSPDGDILATAGRNAKITLWNAKDMSVLKALNGPEWVICVRFSADGSRLLSAGGGQNPGDERKLQVWGVR
jgi:WD40 repeat protein